MKYQLMNPDFKVSPYTGMTRKHWLDVCHFFLDGIFSNLTAADQLPLCPRHEFDISYPNERSSPTRVYAERFEGLARSFLIGAALLCNEPEAVSGVIRIREYYQKQILAAVTPGTEHYMLSIEELKEIALPGEAAYQQTCECASLVIGLDQCRKVIWEQYTQPERDQIAAYLSGFGHGRTTAHNWRLFNMLILAFLQREGYPVDQEMIRDHAQVVLSYYSGDGWYRDGHRFDYYTAWAFQVYGPIWNHWYGYRHEPELAAKIEQYANEYLTGFEYLFDKRGHVTSWARSGIYRNAAAAPFAAAFLLNDPQVKGGLARRINSAALLQFISREEVFVNGVPCLGFYGPYPPILQDYNCVVSPYWMGSAMMALSYPDDHPFWAEPEQLGRWEAVGRQQQDTRVMDGPGIVAALLGGNQGVEFRTGKCLYEPEHEYLKYYLRLAFHSHFHWEDFDYQGVEAMQYSLVYDGAPKAQLPNIMLYSGVKGDVLYRKEYFNFHYNFQGAASLDLADFAVAEGMVRVDKMRIPEKPFTLTIGSYGLPELVRGGPVTVERRKSGQSEAVILHNGRYQLAMVTYHGFDRLNVKCRHKVNAESDISWMAYAVVRREKYYGYEPYVLVSSVLSRDDGQEWPDQELFLIKEIDFEDRQQCGGYGEIRLMMQDGRIITVDYEGIEGSLKI